MKRLLFSSVLLSLFYSTLAQVIPDPPVVIGDEEACEGENTTFTVSPMQGATVEWWDDAVGGTLLAETESYTTPPLEVGGYDFYVNQVFEGIASQRSHVQLVVFAKPTISTSTNSGVFCQGDLVEFVFDGASLYDVSLNGTLTDQVQSEAGTTQASINYTVNESTSFQVVGYLNGCQSTNNLHVSATVFDVPSPPDFEICFGESSTVNFSPNSNPVTYLWSQEVEMNGNQATLSPSNNTSYNLTVVENTLGCEVELNFNAIVNPSPEISLTSDFTAISGEKIVLSAEDLNDVATSASWTTSHGNYGTLSGFEQVFVPTNETVYTATLSTPHGCQDTEGVTVSISELPEVFGETQLYLGSNGTAQTVLTAIGEGPFQWYNQEVGGQPIQNSLDEFTTPELTESTDFWVSGNGGERKKVSIHVAEPTNDFSIEASSLTDNTTCVGNSFILTPIFAETTDVTFEWFKAGEQTPFAISFGSNAVVVDTEPGVTNYYAQATSMGFTALFDEEGRYEWIVPEGVTSIEVDVVGARSTYAHTSGAQTAHSYGGRVVSQINVNPGDVLFLRVGGYNSGFNGGGWADGYSVICGSNSSNGPTVFGGRGGGATDIRIGGEDLTDRIVVAGGAGGGQWESGCDWGQWGISCSGAINWLGGSGGGLVSQNGSGAPPGCPSHHCAASLATGAGGSQTSGGEGNQPGGWGYGGDGGSVSVGSYCHENTTSRHSGGGGGWFGGGGGEAAGGGSSYTSDLFCSNVEHEIGFESEAYIKIRYTPAGMFVSNHLPVNGDGIYDECGVCNGPGAIYVCGCGDIPEGDCACGGLINDACGECGGTGVDSDGDGVCDSQEVYGCQDESACNYNEEATEHDMSLCQYLDACGVCGGDNNCCQAQYSATSVSTSSCLSSEGEITAQVAGCEPILVSQPAITYLVQFLTLGDVPSCFNIYTNPESCWNAQSMVSWIWNSSSSWYEWLGEYNHEDIMSSLEYIMEQGSSTPHITAFYNWMSANSAAAQSCFNDGDCQQLFYSAECCPAWNESLWNPDNYIPDIFLLVNDLNDLQTFSAPGCAATIAPVVDSSQCREVAVQLIMSSNYGPISFSLLDGMGEIVEDINGSLIQDSFCDDGYIQSNGYIACSGASSYIQGNNPIFHACLTEGECYVVQMYAEQNGLCEGGGCTNPSEYDAWGDGYNAPYVRITDEEVGTAQNFTFYEGQEGSEDYCVIPYVIQPNSGNTSEGEFVFSGLDPGSYNVNFVTNYGAGDIACSGQLTVEIDCCENDVDSDGVCDDVDDCIGAYNTCGVCNGPDTYECGCSDIPAGDCDCDGNQLDALGVCGGDCAIDADQDGICDSEDDCVGALDDCGICMGDGLSCSGCTYIAAMNYNSTATIDNGTCTFNISDACPGDFNGDDYIGIDDILSMLSLYDTSCSE